MGIAKTVISEICIKDHQLRGFGMLNGVWGLGLIVGPAIGGKKGGGYLFVTCLLCRVVSISGIYCDD